MTPDRSSPIWLREANGWLTNRAAWPERLGNIAFLLIAAFLVLLSLQWLSIGASVLVWTLYIFVLGVCSWMGWIKLLGPVLFYDMVRTSRRNRYFIMRMLYAGFLFFILTYMVMIGWLMQDQMRDMADQGFRQRQNAVLAETFFMVFMLVQLTLVVLLTPAYVAGAIADEKDRKTIEFMLATDLRNREIVLSKFFSRLANMALLLLTGLPILSILQFIGGVDPELMLAGFIAIALTMLGIGGISILFSTLFKKPRDAISLTYLLMIAYAALATTGWVLQQMPGGWLMIPLWFGDDPPTISSTIGILNAGNPLVASFEIGQAIGGRGGGLARALPGVLERYAWFHLSLAVVCVTWSIVRLRSIALKQTVAGETVKQRWWQRLRPPVSDWPMLWKEIFVESRTKLNWLIWIAVFVLVLLTLGSGLFVLGVHIYAEVELGIGRFWERLGDSMNIWFRIAGTFVACLMLLMTGVRASTSITSERERNTFDALVASPLTADGMLFAKLLGNITGMKLGWIWFASLVVLALFTGGLHPASVPIIFAGCFVYAVFMTMLGLMFSVYCSSSLQAATFTVLTTILLGGGHWIVTSCFCMPLFGALMALISLKFQMPHEVEEMLAEAGFYFIKFQAGVTPPFVFPWCSFSYRQIEEEMRFANRNDRHFWELVAFSVLGLFLWGAASVLLWFLVLVRKFRRVMRRIELDDVP